MAGAEREQPNVAFEVAYSEINRVFNQLDIYPGNPNQRQRDLSNGKLSISDLGSQKQERYLVRARNTTFTISKSEGVETINLPKLLFPIFDNHLLNVEPIDVTKKDIRTREYVANMLSAWVRNANETGIIQGVMAFEPHFEGETKF